MEAKLLLPTYERQPRAGLMQAVDLDSPELAKAVTKQLLQERIIINRTHETVLRFLPPYVIQKKHVDQVVKALDRALRENAEFTRQDGKKEETKAATGRRKEVHAHA
jgi:acetylornithine aminotransferase/acetylornithine/N-succinyldiaminopimelate aminotransferase